MLPRDERNQPLRQWRFTWITAFVLSCSSGEQATDVVKTNILSPDGATAPPAARPPATVVLPDASPGTISHDRDSQLRFHASRSQFVVIATLVSTGEPGAIRHPDTGELQPTNLWVLQVERSLKGAALGTISVASPASHEAPEEGTRLVSFVSVIEDGTLFSRGFYRVEGDRIPSARMSIAELEAMVLR